MTELESPEKIAKDIAKLERNLNQVSNITFEGKEKEVYDRAIDYWNDSKYYLEKEDMRTAFGCIEYSHGLLDALRIIHDTIDDY
ncbi:DUF357 domain-containing protein [bacterium]|nr:DUF357 domain-containing protein [bacterium]